MNQKWKCEAVIGEFSLNFELHSYSGTEKRWNCSVLVLLKSSPLTFRKGELTKVLKRKLKSSMEEKLLRDRLIYHWVHYVISWCFTSTQNIKVPGTMLCVKSTANVYIGTSWILSSFDNQNASLIKTFRMCSFLYVYIYPGRFCLSFRLFLNYFIMMSLKSFVKQILA